MVCDGSVEGARTAGTLVEPTGRAAGLIEPHARQSPDQISLTLFLKVRLKARGTRDRAKRGRGGLKSPARRLYSARESVAVFPGQFSGRVCAGGGVDCAGPMVPKTLPTRLQPSRPTRNQLSYLRNDAQAGFAARPSSNKSRRVFQDGFSWHADGSRWLYGT
jgi:hypothetical protein